MTVAPEATASTEATASSATTATTNADGGAETTGSTDAATTTVSVAPGDPALCAAFTGLADLDAAVAPITTDFPSLQAAVLDLADDLEATYAEVRALAPAELHADIDLVAEFTTASFVVIASATDLDDATSQLVALPGATDAAAAAVRINAYSEAACGVSISGP